MEIIIWIISLFLGALVSGILTYLLFNGLLIEFLFIVVIPFEIIYFTSSFLLKLIRREE